ncbi:PAQR family membrane homeostasis protein TrhA [Catellatospora tritici]|uniref:PAQR family membrane homeostasis protein TrhA n=1 Tax=Catellatospora tritici TaxID=2851566 RepID=UPI003558946C
MTSLTTRRPSLTGLSRPRMRGLLHVYGFFAAVGCGTLLVGVAATRPGTAPAVSTAIYSATACALFAVSGLYHRRAWTERGYQVMRRLDHAMIFVFIAGTYTPLCVLLLDQAKATALLTIVWAGALAGGGLSVIWPNARRSVFALLYLAMGWAAVVILPDVAEAGGMAALILLAVGGIVYSAGAVLFALRRPDPWPAVFGHHEVFHACTLVAALCHYIAISLAVFA